ncbi:MAG: branched-chain amino acid ABC transporter permease [Chloroflexi bacterium]|nr:branched-chain amino acid ABC transporter permease [Chloroflexota bacterium]
MLPCGTYPRTYNEDKAIVRTRLQWLLLLLFLILLFTAPLFLPTRYIGIIIMMAIICLAVIGLQITTGYAGQINIGQAAFMGTGAYVTAYLAHHFELPFWLTVPAGGAATALVSVIFGFPAARVKGLYLALTSLAFMFIFPFIFLRLPGFGGTEGLSIKPAALGPVTFVGTTSLYYLIMVVSVLMVFFAYSIVRSRIGRAFTAVRDADNAAEILGINVFYYKTMAFVIGTFFAGIAGGLWAYYFRFVNTEQFTLFHSIWFLGMIIVGGMGSILGAIIGTVGLRGLEELITYLGPILAETLPFIGGKVWFAGMNILLGAVIILFIIFEPRGIVHRWNILKATYRLWPFPY